MTSSPFHHLQDFGEVHKIANWQWPDEPSRLSEVVTSDDVGKFGLQQDTGSYYELTAVSPDTWILRMGNGTSHAPATLSVDAGNNLLSLTGQEIGLDNQGNNLFFSGPASGGASAPSFRPIQNTDIPDTYYVEVSSTGPGLKTIQSIPIQTDQTISLHTTIVGRQTGGGAGSVGDSLRWIVTSLWKDIGGSVSQVGTTTTIDSQDDGTGFSGAVYGASGGNIEVRFSLLFDTDLNWSVKTMVTVIS